MAFRNHGYYRLPEKTTTQIAAMVAAYGPTGTLTPNSIAPGAMIRNVTTGEIVTYDGAGTFQVGTVYTPPVAPANTAVPTISGTLTVGSTLTAADGTWTGVPAPTFTYQWYVDSVLQVGATASTFVAIAGSTTVQVTGTNAVGFSTATSAASVVV